MCRYVTKLTLDPVRDLRNTISNGVDNLSTHLHRGFGGQALYFQKLGVDKLCTRCLIWIWPYLFLLYHEPNVVHWFTVNPNEVSGLRLPSESNLL